MDKIERAKILIHVPLVGVSAKGSGSEVQQPEGMLFLSTKTILRIFLDHRTLHLGCLNSKAGYSRRNTVVEKGNVALSTTYRNVKFNRRGISHIWDDAVFQIKRRRL